MLDAELDLPNLESANRGFSQSVMPLWSTALHSQHIDRGWNPETDRIVEINETVFENTDATNTLPPEHHTPSRSDLTRLDSDELRICNFHINSKMLHKGYGGYDLVRTDFTSLFMPL